MKKLIVILIIMATTASAQEIKLPVDPEMANLAKEKLVLFSDNFRDGDLEISKTSLDWLLKNCPDIAPIIYINGIKLYEVLEQGETDHQVRLEYQEKILWMYDQRLIYFNDHENVINRKSHAAYKYYRDKDEKLKELLKLFDEAFQYEEKYIFAMAPLAYMDVIKRYQQLHNDLSKEVILVRYHRISEVQREKSDNDAMMNEIDKMLLTIITIDCEEIMTLFGKKEHSNELEAAKKFMAISLAHKCTATPKFQQSAIIVHRYEPTPGLAKIIAILSEAKQDYGTAEKYFIEALKLSIDNHQSAEANYLLAVHYKNRGMKETARSYALKVVESEDYRSRAYRLIGDLYFSSVQNCMNGKSQLSDRAIYLAAFEMYQKAGDDHMMDVVRRQFPSAEDIHAENKQEGELLTVGCWINENVVIRKRAP